MFRVRWKKSALADVAALWTAANSADRQTITRASHQIDQMLRGDPAAQGESRPRGRRIMFVAPLGILFRVQPGQATVSILQVWRY